MAVLAIVQRKIKSARKHGLKKCILIIIKMVYPRTTKFSLVKNYLFFDQVIHSLLYRPIRRKLRRLPPRTNVFLISRHDFGTLVSNIHYAMLWEKTRGKGVFLVLTKHLEFALSVLELTCPGAKVITYKSIYASLFSFILKDLSAFDVTINNVYSLALLDRVKFVCLWEHQPLFLDKHFFGNYIDSFDPHLKDAKRHGQKFVNGYLYFRRRYFVRDQYWEDYRTLQNSFPQLKFPNELKTRREHLLHALKVDRPYMVLNLSRAFSGCSVIDRRRIHVPERFDSLIDICIEKGYQVILQGRDEQPRFKERPYFFQYAHSHHISPINDMLIFSGAEFVVSSKTGAENFCELYNIPILGVNYNEFALMLSHVKRRYFFKHIKDSEGNYLTWKDLLSHPLFFEFGGNLSSSELKSYSYEEMNEEEIVQAFEEFLSLVDQPEEEWLKLSSSQQRFRDALDPSHFDLYNSKALPCNAYLESVRSGT